MDADITHRCRSTSTGCGSYICKKIEGLLKNFLAGGNSSSNSKKKKKKNRGSELLVIAYLYFSTK